MKYNAHHCQGKKDVYCCSPLSSMSLLENKLDHKRKPYPTEFMSQQNTSPSHVKRTRCHLVDMVCIEKTELGLVFETLCESTFNRIHKKTETVMWFWAVGIMHMRGVQKATKCATKTVML